MDYYTYQNIRNAAWQCLIDCKIDRLPVELGQICKTNSIQIKRNSSLDQGKLLPNERGKTVCINGKYFIIIDVAVALPIQRYTIAHEIGHILLGAKSTEQEAERFAIGILAPACVLHALGIDSAQDIAKLCNISITAASHRSERMKILNQRNAFLKHPLERAVYEQFKPFIQLKKANTN